MNRRLFTAGMMGSALLAGCRKVATDPPETEADGETDPWRPLLGQWRGVEGGEVVERDGVLSLGLGYSLTAARWDGEPPRIPFEIEAEARRLEGIDFFYSVTFRGRTPEEAASLIVGGWGGGVVGISSIDGLDASENESAAFRSFESARWYAIRLRATAGRIETWIDGKRLVDVSIEGRELSLRPGPIDACLPFGVASWETAAEVRAMRWKPLAEG